MKLWRISNHADLSGAGGLRFPGRWHNKGIPIVYLAESPALAMLEVLVHFELLPDDMPDSYQLLEVDYRERKGISRLAAEDLPDNWTTNVAHTRAMGDAWLVSMRSLLLKVPSAIVPHSANYLFNPRHPLAKDAEILTARRYPFDPRLF